MPANLGTGTWEAFGAYINVRSVTGWTDTTVVLRWLIEKENYKIFIANRVKKILEYELN